MLVHEKADQALLGETNLDCWLIFARETGVRPDPGVELVVGSDITWNSAFLFGGFVHDQFRARGLPSAWSWDGCPIVNSGPESEPGHATPRGDILVEPGHLVHIDLGVKHEGYCSDLQREKEEFLEGLCPSKPL